MSVYRQPGSKIYWMDFQFEGQRIRESTGMASITRARDVETKRKQELRDSAAGIRKREGPKLFSVAYKEWIGAKEPRWSHKTRGIAENSLKHLAPWFAKRLLVDIEAEDTARYQKARLAENASHRSINMEVGCLRSVLKRHGLWARLQPRVDMLPECDDCGRALTAEEESNLLAECGKSRSRILVPCLILMVGGRGLEPRTSCL